MTLPTVSKLPAPIYPDFWEILRKKEQEHQEMLRKMEGMQDIYLEVCAILRNYEVKQNHNVTLYPNSVMIRITLDHDDLLSPFHQLWQQLYLVLKPTTPADEISSLTVCSWGPELSACVRELDGLGRSIDLTITLPVDGCRDYVVERYEIPSTTTRYKMGPAAIVRQPGWYNELIPF